MHKKLSFLVVFLSLSSAGCSNAVNKTLLPPDDTKWVKVEIKNPSSYTKPFPLEVRYISQKCKKNRISGFDGSNIQEPNYNVFQVQLDQESADVWRAEIALNGGGSCNWKLSSINLGIKYVEVSHLGKDLVPGTAVGATVAFDDDASRNGKFTVSKGRLTLTPKYYPYISEWNMGEKRKELSLLGRKSFLSIKLYDSNEIYFYPEIDESKVVRYVGIEKKIKGARSKIIYPDGSVGPNDEIFPDFNKVDKMKL